ncbi:hypothetical protein JCGZ_02655 [Jatropha curcas]|uniref:Peroxidase n=1 Tax=Jatropha curcas TaxID=180498 RepID=A0A067L559_JATCU|nr:peroxidase 44 [Jatropha curcas]KDP39635.1 hypothetical protein JCGZ_02655 [Jatropha curcas]
MTIEIPFLLFLLALPLVLADLRLGFYQSTCPQAESIVLKVVQNRFKTDRSITGGLLRMHFHDCFVRGCDASILIDSTNQRQSEKDAGPNETVRGYELIDEIKQSLEIACPKTVSCADIITLATRDAVVLAGGPNYTVPTGRRDGLASNIEDVNLPGPTVTVSEAFQVFRAKGLSFGDMVTLLGAHTVGFAHCSFFTDRLATFQGGAAPDPTMDSSLASNLSKICGSDPNRDPTVSLDQSTGFTFDNEYYKQLLLKKGILQIDQELAIDRSSARTVLSFARNGNAFKKLFGNAMVKLGRTEVLVGNDGEVRTNCRVFNAQKKVNPAQK